MPKPKLIPKPNKKLRNTRIQELQRVNVPPQKWGRVCFGATVPVTFKLKLEYKSEEKKTGALPLIAATDLGRGCSALGSYEQVSNLL